MPPYCRHEREHCTAKYHNIPAIHRQRETCDILVKNGFVEKLRQEEREADAGAAECSNEGHSELRILAEGVVSLFEEQHAIRPPFLPLPATCRLCTVRASVRVVRKRVIQLWWYEEYESEKHRRISRL